MMHDTKQMLKTTKLSGFILYEKDEDNDCQEANQVDDENETTTEVEESKDKVETRNVPKTNDSKVILPSSSTGRKRWLPNVLFFIYSEILQI